ncbi:CpaD family pilus assembly protein [Oryzibacter oryziterrae]|uniref:CpaD family pilus assembly protein n=1 Tax=Oryzibacter oryziterrae TaxID=2766474 RepID=UPI001F203FF3|nr:CpaD family pilus assembly protein [Oryzibacter oryziterrae]
MAEFLPTKASKARVTRVLQRSTLVLLAGLALAGCNSQGQVITEGLPTDGYRTRYPIAVAEAPQNLDIPVGSGATSLQPFMRDIVLSFADDAVHNATGTVVILTPAGSGNQMVASYVARDVHRVLRQGGLPERMIETRNYSVGNPGVNAPLRLSFNKIKAVSPPCGQWTSDAVPDDSKGGDGAEFGCSTQANLAAMVENPNDLITPRAETPVPMWRRWQVMQSYQSGGASSGS